MIEIATSAAALAAALAEDLVLVEGRVVLAILVTPAAVVVAVCVTHEEKRR